ncbi:MAG: VOC family protein [Candidatus Baltobacteraceae bacterium]
MELEPYLFFDGTCEEALNFYAGIFNGEITSLNRFEGTPGTEHAPAGYGNKIMHANFKSPSLKFMASDMPGGDRSGEGRISLSLASSDVAEGTRVFDALAEGGKISMPLAKQFWGDTFGSLTDKYGIDWMVNCSG